MGRTGEGEALPHLPQEEAATEGKHFRSPGNRGSGPSTGHRLQASHTPDFETSEKPSVLPREGRGPTDRSSLTLTASDA